MPKIDGLQACMRIREFSNVPIIMLTARSEDTDKIIGFEYGADDYITKPFSPAILRARVNARLRRETKSSWVELDGFRFDFDRMGRFSVDENALPVTVKRLRGKLEDNPSGLNT